MSGFGASRRRSRVAELAKSLVGVAEFTAKVWRLRLHFLIRSCHRIGHSLQRRLCNSPGDCSICKAKT